MNDIETILLLLKNFLPSALLTSSVWIVIVIILFYKLYQEPEKLEKWASFLNRLLSWVGLEYEKRGVAGDIQADIRKTSRLINSQVPKELLPYGLKIKWIDKETRNAFVKNKKVVVRMQHHRNQAKNFMYATLSYAEFGLIPQAKVYIETHIARAIELIFTNKVFTDNKRYDVRQIFLDEIFNPETQSSSTLERYCNVMDGLEKKGNFTRIALKEFSELVDRVSSDIPRKEIIDETVGFTKVLERLSRKRRDKDIYPDYNGKFIKCSIVLVARPETYLLRGIQPWLNLINNLSKKGINTFYVSAIGDENISIAQEVANAYGESKEIKIISKDTYSIRGNGKAICIILERI